MSDNEHMSNSDRDRNIRYDEVGRSYDGDKRMRENVGDGDRTIASHEADDSRAYDHPRLVHLKDSNDLAVADGEPDIRGWDLQTADGQTIGKVEDLIVDTSLMKVRYIEGKLKHDDSTAGVDRLVLFPMISARLDDGADTVILEYSIMQAQAMPTHTHDSLSKSAFDGDELDDANFFGTRRRGREASNYIAPRREGQLNGDFDAL